MKKIAQASKSSHSNAQHFLSDLLTHSWFHSMLFALPGYRFPYIVMNRCFYLIPDQYWFPPMLLPPGWMNFIQALRIQSQFSVLLVDRPNRPEAKKSGEPHDWYLPIDGSPLTSFVSFRQSHDLWGHLGSVLDGYFSFVVNPLWGYGVDVIFTLFRSFCQHREGACVRVQPCCGFLNMMAVPAAAGLSF
jgi:hypothetical protein